MSKIRVLALIIFISTYVLNSSIEANDNGPSYLTNGAVVLGSIALGNLATRSLYKDEDDKLTHAYVGGALSATATLASLGLAYYIPDDDISPVVKKLLIGCSGFVLSTVAGALKEGYDSRHGDRHTADVHDAYATSLGGGAGMGCLYSFAF